VKEHSFLPDSNPLGHSLAMNNEQEDDVNGQQGIRRHLKVMFIVPSSETCYILVCVGRS
jgi:hypothetical protein